MILAKALFEEDGALLGNLAHVVNLGCHIFLRNFSPAKITCANTADKMWKLGEIPLVSVGRWFKELSTYRLAAAA